jgi:hypothetical protein
MLNESRKCLILRRALCLAPSIARIRLRANTTCVRVGWSAGHSAATSQMDHHQASAESSPRILAHAWKHRHRSIGVSLLREHDSRSLCRWHLGVLRFGDQAWLYRRTSLRSSSRRRQTFLGVVEAGHLERVVVLQQALCLVAHSFTMSHLGPGHERSHGRA